jgi:hypothetical protein
MKKTEKTKKTKKKTEKTKMMKKTTKKKKKNESGGHLAAAYAKTLVKLHDQQNATITACKNLYNLRSAQLKTDALTGPAALDGTAHNDVSIFSCKEEDEKEAEEEEEGGEGEQY